MRSTGAGAADCACAGGRRDQHDPGGAPPVRREAEVEWPATALQLPSEGQERHDGARGGCPAPGVAASCLPGVANFPASSFQQSNRHPETSFRPILARVGAFEMGSGWLGRRRRSLKLRASRFGRSVNDDQKWLLQAPIHHSGGAMQGHHGKGKHRQRQLSQLQCLFVEFFDEHIGVMYLASGFLATSVRSWES